MIRILAIGNSFSEDATCYLHGILQAAGVEAKVVNLYIGGCPLEKHWANIVNTSPEYQYQINGILTDRYVTIEEALQEEKWDHIITQQASHDSGWENSYEPFLGQIVAYLKEKAPEAVLHLHETWAYDPDSDHWAFPRYGCEQQLMYQRLSFCYKKMAAMYDLDLIPTGDLVQCLRSTSEFDMEKGGLSLCRDGFHMSYVYGRYLVACIWAKKLAGIVLKGNGFVPVSAFTEDGAEESLLEAIREAVDRFGM